MPDIFSLTVFSVVLIIALSLLAYQAVTGVPPMPASVAEASHVIRLLQQAGIPEQAVIYELGSGWGTLAIALAHAFPGAHVRGIELSPFPCWIARIRTRNMRNVSVQRGNFYVHDLHDADAVTCYLMAKPMPKLAAFLDTMLKSGTPVVSIAFAFRDRKATLKKNDHGELTEAILYYWPAISHSVISQETAS